MGINADKVDGLDASASREAGKLLALGTDGMFPDGACRNIESELQANRPVSPVEGDTFVAIDTTRVYVCFADGTWTQIYP